VRNSVTNILVTAESDEKAKVDVGAISGVIAASLGRVSRYQALVSATNSVKRNQSL